MKINYLSLSAILITIIFGTALFIITTMSNFPIDILEKNKQAYQVVITVLAIVTILFTVLLTVTESKINKLQKIENDSLKLQLEQNHQKNLELQIELTKIEERTKPRKMSETQFANCIQLFSQYKNISVYITSIRDAEAQYLFDQLIDICKISNWSIIDSMKNAANPVVDYSEPLRTGIAIFTTEISMGEKICSYFESVGIKSDLNVYSVAMIKAHKPNEISFMIYEKP